MRRRKFIVLLGGAAVAGPVAGRAQPGKAAAHRHPGAGQSRSGAVPEGIFAKACATGLHRGAKHCVRIPLRRGDRPPPASLAPELVPLKVDIIVAFQTPAVTAAKQATTGDSDRHGVRRRSGRHRPRGQSGAARWQHHGVAGAGAELGEKPRTHPRSAAVRAPRGRTGQRARSVSKPFVEHIENAGRALGIEIKPSSCGSADDLEASIAALQAWRAEAVLVQPSLPQAAVAKLALKHRLPAFAPNTNFPCRGLMSYSADQLACFASRRRSSTRSSRAASRRICRYNCRPSSTWWST